MKVLYLGLQAYDLVYKRMQQFTELRGSVDEDELWVVEHFPVYTLGKSGGREHLLYPPPHIPVVQTDRGGQVTYHGPGQVVVYTLINFAQKLISVHELVNRIEEAILKTLEFYDVAASRESKGPGVYVNGKKIASLGLRIRRNYTYHGLSLNVDMDLAPFDYIHPCGHSNLKMTQLRDFVQPCPKLQEVGAYLVEQLKLTLQ
ncbi:MAG: lipoyl(octanoyl) transferase LipB [Neisseriaceae bacterium]